MKKKKATFNQSPFGNLKELLKNKNIKLSSNNVKNFPNNSEKIETDPVEERKLFKEAMSDVIPIKKRHYIHSHRKNTDKHIKCTTEGESSLKKLNNLIESGEGFVIAQTAEYIEGTNSKTHPEITRLLHGGHFSIQDHIDLHGLNVEQAKKELDHFMKESVATRKKGILIVHGRGLSSPVEPVLKKMVYLWLSKGPWRKWVLAFASARACDGGAGATYVLLREQPAKKKRQKKIP